MSCLYDREDELQQLLDKLDTQNPEIAVLKDMFGELTMLLQVRSVDLEETNSNLVEKEELLKLLEATTDFADNDETLKNLSNDLAVERKNNIKITGELNEFKEQLQILETGNTQYEVLNKKLVEKDACIREIFSNLEFERKQRDKLIDQYKEQENNFRQNKDALVGKEQQFQNMLSLYQTEKLKRETAIQEKSDKENELRSLHDSLKTEKHAHEATLKSLDEHKEHASRLQARQSKYEELSAQVSSKNQLVQKISSELTNERKSKDTLNQKVKELEAEIGVIPTLRNKLTEEQDKLSREKNERLLENESHNKKFEESTLKFGELSSSYAKLKDSHYQLTSDLMSLTAEHETLSNEHKQLQHVNLQLTKDVETLKIGLQKSESKAEDLHKANEQLQQDITEKSDQLRHHQNIQSTKEQEIQNLRNQLEIFSQNSSGNISVDDDTYKKIMQENEAQSNRIKEILQTNEMQLSQTKEQLMNRESELQRNNATLDHLQKTNSEKDEEIEKIKTSLRAMQTHVEHEKQQRTSVEQKLTDLPSIQQNLEVEKKRALSFEQECQNIHKQIEIMRHDLGLQILNVKNITVQYEEEKKKTNANHVRIAELKQKNDDLMQKNEILLRTKTELERQQSQASLKQAGEDAKTNELVAKFSNDPVAKDAISQIVTEKLKTIQKEHYGAIRSLEIDVSRLSAINADKDRMIANANNNAFVKHLEGSLKQHKAKIDSLMSEIASKDTEITRLKSK